MISATTAPAMQSAPMATLNNAGVPMNMADSMMAGPAGSSNLAQAAKALGTAPTTQEWWVSQPDEVKAILMGGGVFVGGRMLTGALGGLFEGVSVQKRLELEQLINEQRQNQVQYLNKNQTYAPKLNFRQPTGIIAVGKV